MAEGGRKLVVDPLVKPELRVSQRWRRTYEYWGLQLGARQHPHARPAIFFSRARSRLIRLPLLYHDALKILREFRKVQSIQRWSI